MRLGIESKYWQGVRAQRVKSRQIFQYRHCRQIASIFLFRDFSSSSSPPASPHILILFYIKNNPRVTHFVWDIWEKMSKKFSFLHAHISFDSFFFRWDLFLSLCKDCTSLLKLNHTFLTVFIWIKENNQARRQDKPQSKQDTYRLLYSKSLPHGAQS